MSGPGQVLGQAVGQPLGRLVSRVAGRATDSAYALGWSALQRAPEAPVVAAFERGADLAARRDGKGVARLRSNLARVVEATPALTGTDLDALTRQAVRSYARYWREVFRLPRTSPASIVRRTHVEHGERFSESVTSGRGLILALPHMGNWDAAGVWAIAEGGPFTTVAERLEPASLFDRFVAFREGLGMEVLALTGGAQAPFETLADRLRAGRTLCLLADRDLTPAGVPVTFFGAATSMPAGPALLALRTGADLVPVTLWYDDPEPWCIRFSPVITDPGAGSGDDPRTEAERVAVMTQQLADAFAGTIAEHPADWHMLQRLWHEDLSPRAVPA